MRVTYDRDANAVYIYLVERIAPGEAVAQESPSEGITLDFERRGKLLGIEILAARRMLRPSVLLAAERMTMDRGTDREEDDGSEDLPPGA